MFLNFSNHPSSLWSVEQVQAARQYGEIVDLPFPDVDPCADEAAIASFVCEYFEKVKSLGTPDEVTVHLMGEFCFTYSMLNVLREHGYQCIASTSSRKVVIEDGAKKVFFEFCAFRKYWLQ